MSDPANNMINRSDLRGWKGAACRLSGELSESEAYAAAAAAAIRVVRRLRGDAAGQRLAERCIGLVGLPLQKWLGIEDNIHSQALRMRLWNRTSPFRPVPKRPFGAQEGPLRVAYVSEFGVLDLDKWQNYAAFPEEHRLFVFATREHQPFTPPASRHVSLELAPLSDSSDFEPTRSGSGRARYEKAVRELALRLNRLEPDIVILANFHLDEMNDLAMLVDAPCLVARLFGSAPSFHPKVDYCLYNQTHLSFPMLGTTMHSAVTGHDMGAEPCHLDLGPLYPDWGIDPGDNPAWEDRPPWLLFHGNLVQLQSPGYLELVGDILARDGDARFRILGFGEGLSDVLDAFARRGLYSQVEYLGEVDKSLQVSGEFQQRIAAFLREGRLEPDPWPWGGGTARVEAYSAGTPTVHLRMDPRGGVLDGRRMEIDVPALEVPVATASGLEEYRNLCLKCLYDGDFARRVIRDQYPVAERAVDARVWWGRFFDDYRRWLADSGRTAGAARDERRNA